MSNWGRPSFVFAWNRRALVSPGTAGLYHSVVDDVMNAITRPLGIDSNRWSVASILSKKFTAGFNPRHCRSAVREKGQAQDRGGCARTCRAVRECRPRPRINRAGFRHRRQQTNRPRHRPGARSARCDVGSRQPFGSSSRSGRKSAVFSPAAFWPGIPLSDPSKPGERAPRNCCARAPPAVRSTASSMHRADDHRRSCRDG